MSETSYHSTKFFTEDLLAIEIRKTKILLSKPVYLDLSVRDLCKSVMSKFRHDRVKPNYGEKARFFCMDTDCFIVYKRTDDIYKDIAEDLKRRFDTSNYELDRPSPKEKNKESDCFNER